MTSIRPQIRPQVRHLLKQAVRLRDEGLLVDAIQCCQAAIALDPQVYYSFYYLGHVRLLNGEVKAAMDAYRQALTLNPQAGEVYSAVGQVLLKQGRWIQALKMFQQAAQLNPDLPIVYEQQGYTLAKLRRLPQAIRAYQTALKMTPHSAQLHYALGEIWMMQNRWHKAKLAYQQAIALDANHPWAHYRLGMVLLRLGQRKPAIRYGRRAIQLDQSRPEFYYDLAIALKQDGQYDAAVRYYQQAIALDPTFERAYIELQFTPISTPQLRAVEARYRRALEAEPEFALAWGNLGDVLTQQGKIKRAIDCYQKAAYYQTLRLKPELASLDWPPLKTQGPDFLIIGAGKAGTTSLHNYLNQHPQILPIHKKELDFFNHHYDYGVEWYLSHFPTLGDRSDYRVGEASPGYFHVAQVPERIHQLRPDTQLIVLLRNPVDRAISWYYHKQKRGQETRSITEVMTAEMEQIAAMSEADWAVGGGELLEGLYVYKLRRWMAILPPEQVLVLSSEEFFNQTATTLRQVYDALGLPEHIPATGYPIYNTGFYSAVEQDIRQTLVDFFRPHNQALEEFLGRSFHWDA